MVGVVVAVVVGNGLSHNHHDSLVVYWGHWAMVVVVVEGLVAEEEYVVVEALALVAFEVACETLDYVLADKY